MDMRHALKNSEFAVVDSKIERYQTYYDCCIEPYPDIKVSSQSQLFLHIYISCLISVYFLLFVSVYLLILTFGMFLYRNNFQINVPTIPASRLELSSYDIDI